MALTRKVTAACPTNDRRLLPVVCRLRAAMPRGTEDRGGHLMLTARATKTRLGSLIQNSPWSSPRLDHVPSRSPDVSAGRMRCTPARPLLAVLARDGRVDPSVVRDPCREPTPIARAWPTPAHPQHPAIARLREACARCVAVTTSAGHRCCRLGPPCLVGLERGRP